MEITRVLQLDVVMRCGEEKRKQRVKLVWTPFCLVPSFQVATNPSNQPLFRTQRIILFCVCTTSVQVPKYQRKCKGGEERHQKKHLFCFMAHQLQELHCEAELMTGSTNQVMCEMDERPPGAARYKPRLSLQGSNFSFCDVFPRAWLLLRHCHQCNSTSSTILGSLSRQKLSNVNQMSYRWFELIHLL